MIDRDEKGNVVVSFQGDVAVHTQDSRDVPSGTLWLWLAVGREVGEGHPGDPVPDDPELRDRLWEAGGGVLLGFKDTRSVDVVVRALGRIRDLLESDDSPHPG